MATSPRAIAPCVEIKFQAPHAIVAMLSPPLLAAKREWCKTSREAGTTLKIIDAYFAEEARGALAAVDRDRVYVTGPSCGGLGPTRSRRASRAAVTASATAARRPPPWSRRRQRRVRVACWFIRTDSAVPCCVEIKQCVGCTRTLAKTPCWFWHSESEQAAASMADATIQQERAVKF